MNKILKLIFGLLFLIPSMVFAQGECDIDISIADITQGEMVSDNVCRQLQAKLMQELGKGGFVSAPYESRFFVAGRFDNSYNDITGGPSGKVYIKTILTLYIGDADAQKIFATESFELSGVGNSDSQAYQRALNKIKYSDNRIVNFLQNGREKIIEYFDSNFNSIINKTRQAAAARDYDAALFYVTSIPSCCKYYDQASRMVLDIYNQSMNFNAQQLLAKARAAWAANPSADGAEEALSYLSQIDPEASCKNEVLSFVKQINQTTKRQWDFENITKYNNEVELEKRRINAAKDIGVAWAKNRPRTVNRYVFIGRRY